MILGVVSFSFANGSFASIISNYDQHSNSVSEKLETLKKIQQKHNLPNQVFIECK